MVDIGGKKPGGLFGGGKGEHKPEGPSLTYLSQEITSMGTRLRVLEERSTNVKKKQGLLEQNVLSHRKKNLDEVELLKDEIDEMKKVLKEVENRIMMIIKEIQLGAKKEDVDSLKKYVELWEPVNFVTQNQVEGIIQEMLEAELDKRKGK